MIPVLLIAAVAYWLAAPDPVTAGARTAAGTGARAAGAGVRSHWAAGRDGRKLGRTDRRDRWSKSGGFWRNLLRLEHGAVIGGKAAKGAGKLTAAAVRPVPAAVKAGWNNGLAWHDAKVGDRLIPVALDLPWRRQVQIDGRPEQVLDPPWWRREQAQVQAGEQAPEQVQVQGGEQAGDGPEEQAPTTARGHDLPPEFKPGDRLVDGTGKPWTVRDARPQIDADTYDLVDDNGAPGYADIPRPDRWEAITEQDDPTDPPAGTSPAGTPAIPTEGASPVSVNMPSEINDLTTLHGFAQAVIDDAEENGPGSTYAAAAASISEYFGRDFGREVNGTASAFEEAAAAYNQAWQAMLEAAEGMKNESLAAIGG